MPKDIQLAKSSFQTYSIYYECLFYHFAKVETQLATGDSKQKASSNKALIIYSNKFPSTSANRELHFNQGTELVKS